jgi:hypothetical protein
VGPFVHVPVEADSALPTWGVPLTVGGDEDCGAVIVELVPGTDAVAADVAVPDPYAFEATTVTRSVFPIWLDVGTKDEAVAPEIDEQAPPVESQAPHWNAYPLGLFVHVPVLAVSVLPTAGVPLTVGAAETVGGDAVATEATAGVAAEVADPEPYAFDATTVTRSVDPTSPVTGT